jgi:uncharacterized membrane protein YjdF
MTHIRQRIFDGIIYGAAMFGVGFALGTVRQLLMLPHIGLTTALAIEVPIIVALSVLVAKWISTRRSRRDTGFGYVATGVAGLATLLAAEELLSRLVNGRSVYAVWADFPAIATAINIVGLAFFTLMPWLVAMVGSDRRAIQSASRHRDSLLP